MEIIDIDGENLHVFQTTWGISMKISGKMWLMTILKVTKTHSFQKKPQGVELVPSRLRVKTSS